MTRRSILGLLVTGGSLFVAGIVGIPALITGLSPALRKERRPTWRIIGRLDGFPVGEVNEAVVAREKKEWPSSFRHQAVFVWRPTDAEFRVFSRSCTDLGCPLDYDRGSGCFFCPCHGGIFTQDGRRLAGPPNGPMFRYAHRVRDGLLEIDMSSLPHGA